ncbi:hypothetical protein [Gluconobacter morbifer]|uniref:Uncharacterized protein n=1 Tax=Gluconobacter morbifer G707 TaxID=1088869 RepID=G6XG06_9PROT|nr:hypothetical protein [Gluconobacter morbifer]EHH69114.1 hypothetical protein GMO_04210 [Gluconobacter morbifer G707]
MSVVVSGPGAPDQAKIAKEQERVQSERVLKKRFIGMVLGLFLAHVYVALALYYTYIDSANHFHTSWLALFGAFVSSMIFLFHIGIS